MNSITGYLELSLYLYKHSPAPIFVSLTPTSRMCIIISPSNKSYQVALCLHRCTYPFGSLPNVPALASWVVQKVDFTVYISLILEIREISYSSFSTNISVVGKGVQENRSVGLFHWFLLRSNGMGHVRHGSCYEPTYSASRRREWQRRMQSTGAISCLHNTQ